MPSLPISERLADRLHQPLDQQGEGGLSNMRAIGARWARDTRAICDAIAELEALVRGEAVSEVVE